MSEEQIEKVENPFGQVEKRNADEETSVQREVSSEVQAQVVVAQQFPRDERAALDQILNACTRETLAENAVYQYQRGGTDISGPSIRLAEAIAQNWGNITAGIREVEQGHKESTVEAYAWDLQTNMRISKRFRVPHYRYTKAKGNTKLEDPRDIYEMVANQGARRLRACILSVIPGDVTEKAVEQCEATMKANEDITEQGIKKMLEAFEKFGVQKEHIEKAIQRRMDSITPALMARLRKIYNSLKDGMSSPSDWFEMEVKSKGQESKKGVDGLKETVGQDKNTNSQSGKGNQKSKKQDTKQERDTSQDAFPDA